MTEDRTKPPPGYMLCERGWNISGRPACYAEVDTAEGHAADVTYDMWEHYDAIRDQAIAEIVADLRRVSLAQRNLAPDDRSPPDGWAALWNAATRYERREHLKGADE